MQQGDFLRLGKPTSRIGLGCGRLVGRSSLAHSARVIEAALDLGIRYFDTAPSYGMGTSEEVLGVVLGDAVEVTIATKVGIARPKYSPRKNHVRRLAKPVLARSRPLKRAATRVYARSRKPEERPRFEFSRESIRSSIEESLERLHRESVDVLLAHEPQPPDLSREVEGLFKDAVRDGLTRAYGVGIGAPSARWSAFGSIWQAGWPAGGTPENHEDVTQIFHGVVRSALAGSSSTRVSAVVRAALEALPESSLLLVSASTPARLRELLREV